ncbi:MAG TPA: hypothetical protein ENH29_06345 [Bacteroidetes bacterium]|nr:hypothetical protein [Bacteroidota bacterium]
MIRYNQTAIRFAPFHFDPSKNPPASGSQAHPATGLRIESAINDAHNTGRFSVLAFFSPAVYHGAAVLSGNETLVEELRGLMKGQMEKYDKILQDGAVK